MKTQKLLISAIIGLLAPALYGGAVVASPPSHILERPLQASSSLIGDRAADRGNPLADSEPAHDFSLSSAAAISLTTVEIRNDVQVSNTKRLGINVGART